MTTSLETQISETLDAMGNALELSPTAHQAAVAKYNAVGTWLAEDEQFKNVDANIFPQGSFAMGTVVKPKLDSDEYDIDLVFQIKRAKANTSPKNLLAAIGTRLRANDRYKDILKPDPRCWTLKYQGEFNLDVVPAVYVGGSHPDLLAIPDRNLNDWIDSNPKRLVTWFKSRMTIRLDEQRSILAKAREVDIAEVPEQELKTPLQTVVQLLKRHRNETFREDKTYAPSSFLITVLAGMAYQNEGNTLGALKNILAGMAVLVAPSSGLYALANPALLEENVLAHWNEDPRYPSSFKEWHSKATQMLQLSLRADTTEKLYGAFGSGLGSALTQKAAVILGSRATASREAGTLRMATGTGLMGNVGTPVRKHTFFGGPWPDA